MANASDLKVSGFSFAATAAGIKKNGKPDLAIICAKEAVSAAAVFTKNRVKAAPVLLSEKRLRSGKVRAVLVNSGNANACTGVKGMEAAKLSTAALAEALNCNPEEVVMASTGVIGQPLPSESICAAIPSLVLKMASTSAPAFAEAIMTTDRWPKTAAREIQIGNDRVRLLGVAKGAGMIHPNMATTLCFVLTDANIDASLLRQSLRRACDESFNIVTVDGDTSTNDMILALASAKAMDRALTQNGKELGQFTLPLKDILLELAQSMVRDGEGAEHCVTIIAHGLADEAACRKVARCMATSFLVKTALHGCDPNWGRLLMAAGNSGVPFDPNQVQIRIGGVTIVDKGLGMGADAEKRAAEIMKQECYDIDVFFGRSVHSAKYLTSDIGHEYIRINADYRS